MTEDISYMKLSVFCYYEHLTEKCSISFQCDLTCCFALDLYLLVKFRECFQVWFLQRVVKFDLTRIRLLSLYAEFFALSPRDFAFSRSSFFVWQPFRLTNIPNLAAQSWMDLSSCFLVKWSVTSHQPGLLEFLISVDLCAQFVLPGSSVSLSCFKKLLRYSDTM